GCHQDCRDDPARGAASRPKRGRGPANHRRRPEPPARVARRRQPVSEQDPLRVRLAEIGDAPRVARLIAEFRDSFDEDEPGDEAVGFSTRPERWEGGRDLYLTRWLE